ncbi:hypothetical protein P154DRAFT_523040 [Amniculicola lignicola CBS 123094]|uniref:Uncharacterized protein n=1 Tax=Amniculicola lignicola CBS 123094 TaxID=1392246 RepID=A0A6A5WHV3_9PLEO|nr:hypothetical protein P154DRAFT_523040 [Amniculicola lignicola CBS 123094]
MSFKSPSQTLNFSLFEEACTTGNPKVVSELLAKPNSRINGRIKPDQEVGAWTPLVVAIESGYVGVVRAVLKAGASVEGIESTRGQTMISPLQAALVHANAAMVQLLIKKGAKVRPRPWHTWRRGQRRFGCSAYDYNVGKGGVVDPVVFALASQERELYEILRQAKKDQENIRLPAYWSV